MPAQDVPTGNDADLVSRFLSGEAEAARRVEELVRLAGLPFRPRLADEWQDALQEALTRLFEALRGGRFRGEGSLKAYVRQVVCNLCVDRLRSRRVWRWVEIEPLELPGAERSQFEVVRQHELSLELLRVLEEVPAECRALWQMILDGLSYREMSARMEVNEITLRSRVLRCRRRAVELRRRLAGATTAADSETSRKLPRPGGLGREASS